MRSRRHTSSLAGQVVAVNVLMVVASLFAASAAASLNLRVQGQRWEFALLAMTIVLVLLVNLMMLRRRFSPLERLIERVEAIDPAQPEEFDAPTDPDAIEEIDRLAASFRRLLSRIEDERRRSGRLVIRAQEEERRRLARDLHDEVNQALTAILLRLEALTQAAPAELRGEVGELKRLVNQAMSELLQLARHLRPTALDDHGLVSAISSQVRAFSAQTGLAADLETRGEPKLAPDQEIAFYRIAQEALANAARHAAANRVDVQLRANDDVVELTVRDDGCGFDPDAQHSGLGLGGMAERARLAAGVLSIDSAEGAGTTVRFRLSSAPSVDETAD